MYETDVNSSVSNGDANLPISFRCTNTNTPTNQPTNPTTSLVSGGDVESTRYVRRNENKRLHTLFFFVFFCTNATATCLLDGFVVVGVGVRHGCIGPRQYVANDHQPLDPAIRGVGVV